MKYVEFLKDLPYLGERNGYIMGLVEHMTALQYLHIMKYKKAFDR